ncbi:YciI family protein [Solitalea sp. MAHUQ-68]|uniref:YciI family protein n=1 Tax=Solitalea agri TaxID=2953739 RepID=A0A9X2F959_9SPHI|nr:YciI family protein [Solitalea agri]MCO4294631.1 YciI family protein [Solitalea agri]
MKEFMFFIRKQSNSKEVLSEEKHQEFLKACENYIDKLKNDGKLISAQPIEWSGCIISNEENKWKETTIDTSQEIIGGYYHITTDSLIDAIEIARANPEFQFNEGSRIEVRPIKTKENTGFLYPTQTSP